MTFSYRFTYQLCVDAFTLLYWRPFRKVAFGLLFAVMLCDAFVLIQGVREALAQGANIAEAIGADSNPMLLAVLAAMVFIIAFGLTYPKRRARRLYSTSPARDGLVHVSLTADSVDVKADAGASSSFAWGFYEKWREGKSAFVLIAKGGQFQFLPKSAMTDEQLADVRTILASNLPRK